MSRKKVIFFDYFFEKSGKILILSGLNSRHILAKRESPIALSYYNGKSTILLTLYANASLRQGNS